jgi:hypothetical protein
VAGSDGLEQEADVVAERQLADHLADEPVLACIEDRRALRSAVPLARLELVDAVTGLTAKQLGEVVIVLAEEVHREHTRTVAHDGVVGVVATRQADQRRRNKRRREVLPLPWRRRNKRRRQICLLLGDADRG